MDLTITDSPSRTDIPHIDQYFGVWAMEEKTFQGLVDRARKIDLHAHLDAQATDRALAHEARRGDSDYTRMAGGIAVVELNGTLMKHASSFSGGTSTIRARRQLRAAAQDPEIAGIALLIDSPGGTVAGTDDLGKDIAAAAKQKPVHAYISDLGASAAYWAASQATKVFANETALIGSIGTFSVVHDYSSYAEKEGIKVHVLSTGEFKGAGIPGTKVTDNQLAEYQRIVDGLNSHFLKNVAKGRKMGIAKVRELADGRVHIAAEAQTSGLIDGVQSWDATIVGLRKESTSRQRADFAESLEVQDAAGNTLLVPAMLVKAANDEYSAENDQPEQATSQPSTLNTPPENKPAATDAPAETTSKESPMSESNTASAREISGSELVTLEPRVASYNEIVEACDGIDATNSADDSKFVCDQLRQNATVPQAQKAWMSTLKARSDAREQELAELRDAQQKEDEQRETARNKPGVQTVENGNGSKSSETYDDPVAEFNAAVDANIKRGMSRPKAVSAVVKKQPELHAAMIDAHNSEQGRTATLPSAYAN